MMTLDDNAVAMHEWFTSLMKAGFTEDQALKLIAFQSYVGIENDDDE